MNVAQATIASGADQSSVVDVRDQKVARIITPAALDTTKLTFLEAATVDGTFLPVLDYLGVEKSVVIVAAESQSIEMPRDMLVGARFLKLRQGDKTTPVNAGANRAFSLVLI